MPDNGGPASPYSGVRRAQGKASTPSSAPSAPAYSANKSKYESISQIAFCKGGTSQVREHLRVGLETRSRSHFQMKQVMLAVMVALGTLALAPRAHAVVCANGVYRAGCAGPNGAVAVRKAPLHSPVTCVRGVYRAGCVGPHGGAAVVRRPY